MDEDRRDNNNEKVVIEREKRSSLGPIIALVILVIVLILGYLAFQAASDTADESINVPDTIDVNVDNPVDQTD